MRGAIESRPRLHCARHRAVELAAELFLQHADEFFDAHGVEHVFQPRLGAVGAVAVVDKDPHHRVGHRAGIFRLHQKSGVAGEVVMPGDAAERELEPHARRKTETVIHLHRLEADVVGVFQHRNRSGAVEGDVELARQAVERAVVEDVEMPFARVRPRVDQLLRVDARGRRTGDVADVVGAGAARAKTEILDRLDHRDRIGRLDFADLQIGTGGDMRIAAAITLGEIGHARELRGAENAVRDAQPAHVGILVRRDVKQAEKAPAEIVGGFWIFALGGEVLEPAIGVKRVLLAFELFLIGEFAAGSDKPVLRF